MSFTEADLEQLIVDKIKNAGYDYFHGDDLKRAYEDVLLEDDLEAFLKNRYAAEGITDEEINSIILSLKTVSSADIYEATGIRPALSSSDGIQGALGQNALAVAGDVGDVLSTDGDVVRENVHRDIGGFVEVVGDMDEAAVVLLDAELRDLRIVAERAGGGT